MISIRAPGLRYVDPVVATTVAKTRADFATGARSDKSSRLVSSLAAAPSADLSASLSVGAAESDAGDLTEITVYLAPASSSYSDVCSEYR